MAFRSWAARTLFNFSGWEDREGGERRRLRWSEELPVALVWTGTKSELLSIVMAGAIVFGVIRWLQRKPILYSGEAIVGVEVDSEFCFPWIVKKQFPSCDGRHQLPLQILNNLEMYRLNLWKS